jgi:hypothetical protein
MSKRKVTIYVVFVLIVIAIALFVRSQNNKNEAVLPIPTATAEPADFTEYYSNFYAKDVCPDSWLTKTDEPEYEGLNYDSENTEHVEDAANGKIYETWRYYVDEIRINERIVYPLDWSVNYWVTTSDGHYLAQELDPQQWVVRAQALALLAPDQTIKGVATWTYDEQYNGYYWDRDLTCSPNK